MHTRDIIQKPEKHTGLHCLLFALGWLGYMLIFLPFADKVIGPCEGTPGHDYTGALFVLPLYFVAFFGWIFYISRKIVRKKARLIITVLILFIIPLCTAALVSRFFYSDYITGFINDLGWFTYFYEYGCYGDFDLKELPFMFCVSAGTGLSLYLLLMIFKNKNTVMTRFD